MATLNHTNLTTYDVPALKEFFCKGFGFTVSAERGDKLAVLQNAEGFLLTLMYDKRMTPEQGYPGQFHIGFLEATEEGVDHKHETLRTLRYEVPDVGMLERGGPPTYGFYYKAPGGVMVEVSTMNVADAV